MTKRIQRTSRVWKAFLPIGANLKGDAAPDADLHVRAVEHRLQCYLLACNHLFLL
jgi:hypothetical protein